MDKPKQTIVRNHQQLPAAIRATAENGTIQVATHTLAELGQRACTPDRLDRMDISFHVVEDE